MYRRKVDAALQNLFGFLTVVRDATSRAAHGEAGPQDHRIADARGEFQTFVDRIHQLRLRQFETDLLHGVFEEQPVFRFLDGIDLGADQLHAVFVEHAGFSQRYREIQTSLSADGGKQRVGALAADYLGGVLDAERLDIRAI